MSQQETQGIGPDDHIQIKCRCGQCGSHFVICTWFPEHVPEGILAGALYCPECGKQGVAALGSERVPLPIVSVVPGGSDIASMLEKIDAGHGEVSNPEAIEQLRTRHRNNWVERTNRLAKQKGFKLVPL